MSVNPILQLARALSDIDALQMGIADLERRMDAATLAESVEAITALRLELSKLKAAMGQSRNQEAFWRQELGDMKEARKAQGDIAKA
jgi:regulator of replication initiation timing